MTQPKNITDQLADATAEWCADKAKFTELPDDATLGKDLDFVATPKAWSVAKNKLADAGVIGRSGKHFYVLAGR